LPQGGRSEIDPRRSICLDVVKLLINTLTMTNTETHPTVAQNILAQLGGLTMKMLGAHTLLDTGQGLRFAIRGSKVCSKIEITLDPSDTYTVTFWKGRGLNWTKAAELEGVYVDSLHDLIQTHTGLYTRL